MEDPDLNRARAPRRRDRPDEIRAAIVASVIEVIAQRGMGGLTHRAVATEAGVSLSSTTYHFASKAALIAAALQAFATADQARAAEHLEGLHRLRADGTPLEASAFVALLAQEAGAKHRRRIRVAYELQLQAVDDPELQEIVRNWFDAIARITAEALMTFGSAEPEIDARLVLAATDGLRLDALTTEPSDDRATLLHATLARLIHLISTGSVEERGTAGHTHPGV